MSQSDNCDFAQCDVEVPAGAHFFASTTDSRGWRNTYGTEDQGVLAFYQNKSKRLVRLCRREWSIRHLELPEKQANNALQT